MPSAPRQPLFSRTRSNARCRLLRAWISSSIAPSPVLRRSNGRKRLGLPGRHSTLFGRHAKNGGLTGTKKDSRGAPPAEKPPRGLRGCEFFPCFPTPPTVILSRAPRGEG